MQRHGFLVSAEKGILIDPADYHNQDGRLNASFVEADFIQILRVVLARYSAETQQLSFDEVFKLLRLGNSLLPVFKNNNSLERCFVFVNSILAIPDYEPNSQYNSPVMFMVYRRLKTEIHQWLEPVLAFPHDWDSEVFCKLNFKDIVASHYSLMGSSSMNSDKVVQYFINDGMNPFVTYAGHSSSIKERVNLTLGSTVYNADVPMRGAKFVSLALKQNTSRELESILHGLVAISRMGHLNPRDVSSFYSMSIDADTGKHAYANPNNPEGLVSDLLEDQLSHWPSAPNTVPPSMIQRPRSGSKKYTPDSKKRLIDYVWSNFHLPSRDTTTKYLPVYKTDNKFNGDLVKYLEKVKLNQRILIEALAAFAGFFIQPNIPGRKESKLEKILEKIQNFIAKFSRN